MCFRQRTLDLPRGASDADRGRHASNAPHDRKSPLPSHPSVGVTSYTGLSDRPWPTPPPPLPEAITSARTPSLRRFDGRPPRRASSKIPHYRPPAADAHSDWTSERSSGAHGTTASTGSHVTGRTKEKTDGRAASPRMPRPSEVWREQVQTTLHLHK